MRLLLFIMLLSSICAQDLQTITKIKQQIQQQYGDNPANYQHIIYKLVQHRSTLYFIKYYPNKIYNLVLSNSNGDFQLQMMANNRQHLQFFISSQLPLYSRQDMTNNIRYRQVARTRMSSDQDTQWQIRKKQTKIQTQRLQEYIRQRDEAIEQLGLHNIYDKQKQNEQFLELLRQQRDRSSSKYNIANSYLKTKYMDQLIQVVDQKQNESNVRSGLLDEQLRIENVTSDFKQWVQQQQQIEQQIKEQTQHYNQTIMRYRNIIQGWGGQLSSILNSFYSKHNGDINIPQFMQSQSMYARYYFQKDKQIPTTNVTDKQGQQQQLRINTPFYNYMMSIMGKSNNQLLDHQLLDHQLVGDPLSALQDSRLSREEVKIQIYEKGQKEGEDILVNEVVLDGYGDSYVGQAHCRQAYLQKQQINIVGQGDSFDLDLELELKVDRNYQDGMMRKYGSGVQGQTGIGQGYEMMIRHEKIYMIPLDGMLVFQDSYTVNNDVDKQAIMQKLDGQNGQVLLGINELLQQVMQNNSNQITESMFLKTLVHRMDLQDSGSLQMLNIPITVINLIQSFQNDQQKKEREIKDGLVNRDEQIRIDGKINTNILMENVN